MALRPSKALRNYMLEHGDFKHAMSNCFLKFYTGAQPSTPEAAPTGTLLVTISDAGGAPTREVRGTGSVTLTGGASGSVNSITLAGLELMSGAVAFNTDLSTTAADVASNINDNPANVLVVASAVGAVITLTAKYGLGAAINGAAVVSGATTITTSDVNMGSGVAGVSAVNGLQWGDASANVIVKDPNQVWQGTAVADGTAGWFRIEAAVADAGAADSSESVLRLDGSIATSGADLTMGSTAIANTAIQTVSAFSLTFPSA